MSVSGEMVSSAGERDVRREEDQVEVKKMLVISATVCL